MKPVTVGPAIVQYPQTLFFILLASLSIYNQGLGIDLVRFFSSFLWKMPDLTGSICLDFIKIFDGKLSKNFVLIRLKGFNKFKMFPLI